MPESIPVLILAAGKASRMGSPKQLKPIKGKPMLLHVIDRALAVSEKVYVVLGAHADEVEKILPKGSSIQFIHNPKWEEGLGRSIAFGVNFIQQKEADAQAVMVLLGDQPFVSSDYLKEMFHVFEAQAPPAIVASQYPKNIGVPAVFPRQHFPALVELTGDRGAKALMAREDVIALQPPLMDLRDIDTEEDWKEVE